MGIRLFTWANVTACVHKEKAIKKRPIIEAAPIEGRCLRESSARRARWAFLAPHTCEWGLFACKTRWKGLTNGKESGEFLTGYART